MTQEQKDLLLKDICGRIPYSMKCQCFDERTIVTLTGVKSKFKLYFDELDCKEFDGIVNIDYCKPYLFPLSSMTDEKNEAYLNTCKYSNTSFQTLETFNWLNKNHFDYRNLIPMGLAIDATDKNIY